MLLIFVFLSCTHYYIAYFTAEPTEIVEIRDRVNSHLQFADSINVGNLPTTMT